MNFDVYFHGRYSFKLLLSIWSHVNEMEKKMAKIQKVKFHNSLNSFDRASYSLGVHTNFGSGSVV